MYPTAVGMNSMAHKRLFIVLLALAALLVFYVFSREVKRGFLKQTDFNVTVRLQDHMSKRFDEMWEDIAFFVTPVPSIVIVGLLTILGVKKRRWRAFAVPLLFGLLVLGEVYGKNVVHHPSPPYFMIKNPTTIFPKYYVNEQFSYPSGHTARAVFIAVVAWFLTKKRRSVGVALGIITVLIALGRIYLGHHWLSDVIGGAALGSGLGLLTILTLSPIIDKQ